MQTQKGKQMDAFRLVLIAVFTALVFVSNMLSFTFTTPIGVTRFHLGNSICLLSGLTLGPLFGGLAAGIGSMLYDFTNPAFIASAPITLCTKFAMAFVGGWMLRRLRGRGKTIIAQLAAAVGGALSYVLLYSVKSYVEARLVLLLEHPAALAALLSTKLPVSLINAALAVAVSLLLLNTLERAIGGTAMYKRFFGETR